MLEKGKKLINPLVAAQVSRGLVLTLQPAVSHAGDRDRN